MTTNFEIIHHWLLWCRSSHLMLLLVVALQNLLSALLWIIWRIKALLSRLKAFKSLICFPWLSFWSISNFGCHFKLCFLERSTVFSIDVLLIVSQFKRQLALSEVLLPPLERISHHVLIIDGPRVSTFIAPIGLSAESCFLVICIVLNRCLVHIPTAENRRLKLLIFTFFQV